MRLFPKSEDFFQYFDASANYILEASELLHQMVTQANRSVEIAKRIKELEHKADGVTHETMGKLDTTFITPFDREDIHHLICRLDDVIDNIDVAASRIVLYEVETPSRELELLTTLLLKAAAATKSAVSKIKNLRLSQETMQEIIDINRFEDEADQVHRSLIAALFKNEKDPIRVIKLKDVYEHVENALDRCEDVANVLEGVIVKNA
ncbi:MAG: DUF47 family protein [Candidatus Sumerlaeia bacterium]|nr:DUF47 family protein [Candidatus Sumerlaeia bacterium]